MLGGLGVRTGAKLGFDGAGGGRHEDWYSGSARPINTLTKRDGARLRERSRDLTRNDLGAVSIVDKLAIAISGVRPRASTGNAQLDADIDGLFDEWERSASTAGYQTLSGLVWQAISALIDSGGALMRARARRLSDGLPVPMQLELLAVDHLRSDLTQRADGGGRIIQGVEFDALSRLTAYHLWRERPGSEFHDGQAVRVPESTIAHLYWAREIGQVRGVPWLSPAVAAGARVMSLEELKGEVAPHAVLLGFGADCHIASLFPNAEGVDAALALNGKADLVRVTPQPLPPEAPFPRITLTLKALVSPRRILIAAAGAEKATALEKAQMEDAKATPLAALLAQDRTPVSAYIRQ